ncbi:MAG: hypothetical protein D6768_20875 [Chloroflexi bacterium]|nr:MAG: hypothetical protein D6768_20875 [Chloroflexota bacterium]
MKKWGGLGLITGTAVGLVLLGLLWWFIQPTLPVTAAQPPAIPPDATIFISERTLSRLASDSLNAPAAIDFSANGQVQVSTRTEVLGLEPVVHVNLYLALEGTTVTSRLQSVRLGFLTIPGDWLPQKAHQMAALVGQAIETQTPPDFSLVGLSTTPGGVTAQLKWTGRH